MLITELDSFRSKCLVFSCQEVYRQKSNYRFPFRYKKTDESTWVRSASIGSIQGTQMFSDFSWNQPCFCPKLQAAFLSSMFEWASLLLVIRYPVVIVCDSFLGPEICFPENSKNVSSFDWSWWSNSENSEQMCEVLLSTSLWTLFRLEKNHSLTNCGWRNNERGNCLWGEETKKLLFIYC